MKTILYTPATSQDARDFLDDLADAVAGVDRCKACERGFHDCACPDLAAAGIVPVRAEGVGA